MTKILIPTRNRSTSLAAVLTYFDRFYPEAEVIIADGSGDDYAERNRALATDPARQAQVDYRRYPYDMGFFDRLLDVLQGETDPFVIMGSDDDFPVLDALQRGEKKLRTSPDKVTAFGGTLKAAYRAHGDVTMGLSVVRPLLKKQAKNRASAFAMRSFSTTYAVTRREHLIERYKRSKSVFLPGFYDFGVGVHDALAGKVIALPEITYIATRNFNHSYLRIADKMLFMQLQTEFDLLKGNICRDLQDMAGLEPAEAEEFAATLMSRRIVELLGGAPLQTGEPVYLADDPVVAGQVSAFYDLFTPGTQTHAALIDKVEYVVAALEQIALSDDNSGEASTVASLDAQQKKDTSGPVNTKMFSGRAKLAADLVKNPRAIPVNVQMTVPELRFAGGPVVRPQPGKAQTDKPALGGSWFRRWRRNG